MPFIEFSKPLEVIASRLGIERSDHQDDEGEDDPDDQRGAYDDNLSQAAMITRMARAIQRQTSGMLIQ